MVIRDFDIVGTSSLPTKAYPILLVDPDAVLSRAVASQSFKAIPWGNCEFSKLPYAIYLIQLPPGNLPQRAGTCFPRCT
jgi:hypothetical protein